MASLNCGKCAKGEFELQNVVDIVTRQQKDWALLFLPECDGFSDDRESPHVDRHFAVRHWPGTGSWAMSVIIHTDIRIYVKSIIWKGRACRIHINDGNSCNISVHVCHCAHGDDLSLSLADLALLVSSRPARSVPVMMGDMNIDLLPSLPNPWSAMSG